MQKNFSSDANQKWACSACTYLNWPKTIRCVQCETPRENVDNVINCFGPSDVAGAGGGDFSDSSSSRARNRTVSGSSSNDEIYGSSRDIENQFASVYISDLYNNKESGGDSDKSAIGNKQYSTTSSCSSTLPSRYITEPSASSLARIDSIIKSTIRIDDEAHKDDEFDGSRNISALNKTLNTTNLLKNERVAGAPLISDYDKPLLKKPNNNVTANETMSNMTLTNDFSSTSPISTSSLHKFKKIPQNHNNLVGKDASNKLRGPDESNPVPVGRIDFQTSTVADSPQKSTNSNSHLSLSEAARSSLFSENSSLGSESCTSSKTSASNTPTNCNTDKWTCGVCTYDNWPRSVKCVMCLTPRLTSDPVEAPHARPWTPKSERAPSVNQNSDPSLPLGDSISQVQVGSNVGTGNNRISTAGGSPLVSNNRRTLEIDTRWFEACHGVVDGNIVPVERYLAAGGDPARQLTQFEVTLLNRPSAFDIGFTLIHLALRFHQEHVLAILLSQVDNQPTVVKRVPSYAAPDLAMDIRRLAMSSLRQRKGNFHCYYTSELVTFILPSEILDLRPDVQETLFNEMLDRDVQKELEAGQIINWSVELMGPLNSRLYALWNRSAGDCLLDSVLQATWGIFDRDNGLRRALSDSLHECATIFYQRWKENELLHAHLLDFSLNDSQCATDWAKLLSLASKPGSSLEQLHIFALTHILRRPIIVYGVKYVKSFRGETLGYARYEGVYLPLLWDSSFCWKWPIALGYTRGHFSALVGLEPDCVPVTGACAPQIEDERINRSIFLPLNSLDGNILPIHFLSKSEIGKEEMILSQWLDVRFIESGVMVACQRIQKPPPLVGQMVDEWLNHYRRLGEITSAPYLPTATCYSSDESDD